MFRREVVPRALRAATGAAANAAARAGMALVAAVLFAAPALPAPAFAAARAPALGRSGMVVSAQADATRAGLAVLQQGGNAVDAAVAVSLALGVTEPYHSGLGGGGFLLIALADGRVVALDARETAPAAATREMYVAPGVPEDASRQGALAVGTPGLLAGLALAHARFGSLRWEQLAEPAIALAEDGFPIGMRHARILEFVQRAGLRERFPETARIQLPPPGAQPGTAEAPARIQPGWTLRQPELARTLRRIAREGAEVFYRGEIARAIAAEVKRRGGILTEGDLAEYAPKLREPVRGRYRGLEVVSFPPPSSGGIALVEALNILDGFDLGARGAGSSASLHVVAEALKLVFADRAAYLGDADFVDVPVAGLISRAYAERLRARIDVPWWRRPPWAWHRRERAMRLGGPGRPPGATADPEAGSSAPPGMDGGTTHFSITDAAGNAVAVTQTINLLFGSGITVPGTGIVLNDEMDDFSVAPNRPNAFGLIDTRGANAVEPRKRPLSSMTPTLVLREGRPFLVTGSPGGPRIISTVLLSILGVVDYGMDVSEAVSAPRFHHQWRPDVLYVEPAVPRDVVEGLRRRGHAVAVSERNWSSAQAIQIDPGTGWQLGGSDPRSDGLALGY